MKQLKDFKEEIHKCSKCGLCHQACPIYHITGNDCSVSRGLFVMLRGVLNGDLKMTKTINRYLNLCLKCNKCSAFCPSGIDAVDIITAAKHEYFKTDFWGKIFAAIDKSIIFGLMLNLAGLFARNKKSKNFDKKVVYFGGCGSKIAGNHSVVTLMNNMGKFSCCGMPFFAKGDFKNYQKYMQNYIKILKRYETKEIVTACASCEQIIKNYIKWCKNEDYAKFLSELKVKNIFEYLKENNYKAELKEPVSVTYHKPCHTSNIDDITQLLHNTKNLNYKEMKNFDSCCGLSGLFQIGEYGIMQKLFEKKHNDIVDTGAECVLTSCKGCEIALKINSHGKYKVYDLIEFLNKNVV